MRPTDARAVPSTAQDGAVAAAIGGMLALAGAIGIGRFIYTPILPPMMAALGLSKTAAGLIASANFLGYLLGALGAALPGLQRFRRALVLAALAASALTTAAMALGQNLAVFLALRFVGGVASALVLVLGSTIVMQRLSLAGRGNLASLHFAGVGGGIAVSAGAVTGLSWLDLPWQDLWLAGGVLSLAAAPAVAALLPAAARPSQPAAGAGVAAGLGRLVVAYGLFGFGYVITATFLVAIVRLVPAARVIEPAVWVVFGLAAALSVALWNVAAARFGLPRAFALACVVEAAGILVSIGWQTEIGALAAALLVGGTFMGLTALGLMRAQALTSGDPRRALAAMTGAFGLGQIVGPVFAGVLSDRFGSFSAASVAAAFALLVAAALARK